MDKTIYIVAGSLLVVYFLISMFNKRQNRARRNRKFMEGKRRHKDDGNN